MGQKLLSLDIFGGLISLAMITSLLLPLQWGGNTRDWNDPVVIGLLAAVSFFYSILLPLNSLRTRHSNLVICHIVWSPPHHLCLMGMVHGVSLTGQNRPKDNLTNFL